MAALCIARVGFGASTRFRLRATSGLRRFVTVVIIGAFGRYGRRHGGCQRRCYSCGRRAGLKDGRDSAPAARHRRARPWPRPAARIRARAAVKPRLEKGVSTPRAGGCDDAPAAWDIRQVCGSSLAGNVTRRASMRAPPSPACSNDGCGRLDTGTAIPAQWREAIAKAPRVWPRTVGG